MPYPQLIATSVVRSAHQGQSHGGIYIVDIERESFEQVVDWNTTDIEWIGRGHDRGLRGIELWQEHVYVAASDALLIYDHQFRLVRTCRNPYLKHCHEIARCGHRLWIASTGFDSLLVFDLKSHTFVDGFCLRLRGLRRKVRPLFPARAPRLLRFDPNGDDGPSAGDTVHLNNVVATSGDVFCSGTQLATLMQVVGGDLERRARIPLGTHNPRLHRGGVLMQDTARDRVLHSTSRGRELEEWSLPRYSTDGLQHRDLPSDHARQSFGRGLCVTPEGFVAAGSSPSTVSVFEHGSGEPLRRVNLTMDVRNAIHGLEVFAV